MLSPLHMSINYYTTHNCIYLMLQTQTGIASKVKTQGYVPAYVFVIQLIDGRFVIGQAENPSKRIASINSGHNPAVPKTLQVHTIIGVKEQNGERSFASVVSKFCETYGEANVIAV